MTTLRFPPWIPGVLATGIGLFALFFHPAMLDPQNIGWLLRGTDNGENALGLHAWLNDPGRRGLVTHLLNAPDGVSILFTDSNPLWSVLTAPLAWTIGGGVQFIGLWYLLCLILHVGFARALILPHARSGLSLWCGTLLLSLLPTLYVRELHANLCAHWLILWALWLFVDFRRAGDWRQWLPLLILTTLIHNYLLLMVTAIWVSAMLERIVAGNRSDGAPSRMRLAAGAGASLACIILLLALMVGSGGMLSTDTYGRFGMPIDAPWNPGFPALSTFLPATLQAENHQVESVQYLGLGILLTIILAIPITLWSPRIPSISVVQQRLLWLVPACLALVILAVSHRVDFAGRTLAILPMPPAMLTLLDPIRASSRLFWPVAYALALFGILGVLRLSRKRADLLLTALLSLQVLDMLGTIRMVHAGSARAADRTIWQRTRDPRWADAILKARDVTFMPAIATQDLHLFQEIAWRAIDAGRPMRLVYAARQNATTNDRLAREYKAFQAGRLQPNRLYVLLPQAKLPAGAETRLAVLDGVRVLLPTSAPKPAPAGWSMD